MAFKYGKAEGGGVLASSPISLLATLGRVLSLLGREGVALGQANIGH